MRSKKYCILTAVILLLTSISAFASEIEYTALYVGSSKAFVNDIQKQIDADNPDVAVFVENDRSYPYFTASDAVGIITASSMESVRFEALE